MIIETRFSKKVIRQDFGLAMRFYW